MALQRNTDILAPLQLLDCLRSGMGLLLLCMLASLAASALVTSQLTKLYSAEVRLIVTPNSRLEDSRDLLRSMETLERRTIIATFSRLPKETALVEAALDQIKQPHDAEFDLDTRVLPNTNIITLKVTSENAEFCTLLADQLAAKTVELAPGLYRIYSLRKISPASKPTRPSWPSWRTNLLAGAVIGMVLGLLAVFTRCATRGKDTPPEAE
ncbi:MAG: hypothetical protein ABFS24_12820 [Pseudomonadota bacterium]